MHRTQPASQTAHGKRHNDTQATRTSSHHKHDAQSRHITPQRELRTLRFQRRPTSLRMMLPVVMQMAALTHRSQVVVTAVFRRVIQMRRRQNYSRTGAVRRPTVDVRTAVPMGVAAAFAGTFASTLSSAESDALGDGFPVFRVSVSIFGSDRHACVARFRGWFER